MEREFRGRLGHPRNLQRERSRAGSGDGEGQRITASDGDHVDRQPHGNDRSAVAVFLVLRATIDPASPHRGDRQCARDRQRCVQLDRGDQCVVDSDHRRRLRHWQRPASVRRAVQSHCGAKWHRLHRRRGLQRTSGWVGGLSGHQVDTQVASGHSTLHTLTITSCGCRSPVPMKIARVSHCKCAAAVSNRGTVRK